MRRVDRAARVIGVAVRIGEGESRDPHQVIIGGGQCGTGRWIGLVDDEDAIVGVAVDRDLADARTSDGQLFTARKEVKVTIGGCGG